MPLGLGGSIGHAYVEVSVRGDGMDAEVRKILNDAVDDADFKSTGRRAGKDFTDGFDDETQERFKKASKSPGWRRAIENLDWSEALAHSTDNYFNSPNWHKFVKESEERWGDLGTLAAKEMEAGYRTRGNTQGIEEDQRRMQERINLLRERFRIQDTKDAKKAAEEQIRIDLEVAKSREQALRTEMNMMEIAADFRRRQHKEQTEAEEKAERDRMQGIETELHMQRVVAKFREQQAKERLEAEEELQRARLAGMHTDETMARAAAEFHRRRMRQEAEEKRALKERNDEIQRVARRLNRAFTTIEDGMGRAFGRGSRNNFVNAIGSMVRGLTKLVTLGPKLAVGLGKHLTKTFESFGGGMRGGIAAAIESVALLGGSLLGLAAAGPIAAAGLAALSAVLGPIAALMSGLLGIVLALASTLAFALVGAVGVLATALLPLGAGVAVVVGGLIAMSDAQKKVLKSDLKPATDAFKTLGQTAFTAMSRDIGDNAKALAPVIKGLTPLVEGVGTAIADIRNSWVKSVSGPGFAHFTKVLERNIPDMMRSLGNSTRNALGGLGGIFEGAIPTTRRFLGWLERLTEKFNTWANSAKGQTQIRNFFDRAAESAKSLKDFLDDVWDTTTKILGAGKDTGDSLFETMGNQVEKLGDYLEKHPKALEDFFKNAKETATNLGDLAVALGKIFDELDNENNRKNLQDFIKGLTGVADAINALQKGEVSKDQGPLTNLLGAFGALAEQDVPGLMSTIGNGIINGLSGAWNWLETNSFSDKMREWLHIDPEGVQINWSAIIPDINWSAVIPDISWSDFIPKIRWSSFVPKIGWDSLLPDLRWSDLIPKVKWSQFIPKISWGDLIPDINWSDIIPDVQWSDFVPDLNIDAHINWPDPPGWLAKLGAKVKPGKTARGGVFDGAQTRIIGEAGPEAVVPLNRPLAQVDPSVRWLSAVAQGAAVAGPTNSPSSPRTVIESGAITVVTPASDARAVAWETLNYIAAAGY